MRSPQTHASILVLCVALALCPGCRDKDDERAGQVLTLRVVTHPGIIEFDRKRLTAKAGLIELELINEKRKGHNIRVHTGDVASGQGRRTSEAREPSARVGRVP